MDTDLYKTWSADYQLNIPIIDEQHKLFFDIYDEIQSAIMHNDANNEMHIEKILNDLMRYLQNHFTTEENLLRQAGYVDIDEHIKQHEYFVKKVNEFALCFEFKKPLLLQNILAFAKKWILFHILQVDMQYKDCVSEYIHRNQYTEKILT